MKSQMTVPQPETITENYYKDKIYADEVAD